MNESAPPPDERPWRRREYSGPASTLGLAALIAIVVGVAIWYFEIAGGEGGDAADGTHGIVALADADNPTGEAPAAREGRAAPNFRLAGLDGAEHELTDYRGKTVVLNFWASWCGPCRDETPALQAFFEDASADGVVVVGVNQQEQESRARDFAEEFGVSYPVLLDSDGEVSNGYRVGRGLPVTFIIDGSGVIREIHLSSVERDDLEASVAAVRAP